MEKIVNQQDNIGWINNTIIIKIAALLPGGRRNRQGNRDDREENATQTNPGGLRHFSLRTVNRLINPICKTTGTAVKDNGFSYFRKGLGEPTETIGGPTASYPSPRRSRESPDSRPNTLTNQPLTGMKTRGTMRSSFGK